MTPPVNKGSRKCDKDQWRRFAAHPDFVKDHRIVELAVRIYLERARRDGQTLTKAQLAELRPDASRCWLANNMTSRIALAELAVRHFTVLETILPHDACINMVTLIPGRYAVPLSEAVDFTPASLMAWTRQEMRGFNFIAMVEPGFYGNAGRYLKGRADNTVSWHVHVLVWGADQDQLQDRMAEINRRHSALLPGVDVALALEDQRETWEARLRYLLKGVLWEYNIWRKNKIVVDEAGNRTRVPTKRFKQKDRPIRPGNAVRMMRVMEGRTLDSLLFAGGEQGRALLMGIKREMFKTVPARLRTKAEQTLVDRPTPSL